VAQTLPFQNRSNIDRVVLSPDGKTLVTIDIDGFALIINFTKKVVIAHFNFKAPVTAFVFSPDSRFMLVSTEGKKVRVFERPTHKVYSPMVVYKKYGNLHSHEISGACWSHDSRFFVTWSEDLTMKMMSLHKIEGFLPFTFGGHKKPIVKAFFSEHSHRLFTVSANGTILIWKWTDDKSEGAQRNLEFHQFKSGKRLKTGAKPNEFIPIEEDTDLYSELEQKITTGRFLLEKKTKIATSGNGVRVVSCEFSPILHGQTAANRIMVIGQSNGVFGVFNVETLESIHSF
jgi:periodic tryptophan protein 2